MDIQTLIIKALKEGYLTKKDLKQINANNLDTEEKLEKSKILKKEEILYLKQTYGEPETSEEDVGKVVLRNKGEIENDMSELMLLEFCKEDKFAHYIIKEPIAVGGMGKVYKAYDTKLGRMVALKFPKEYESKKAKERFVNEVQVIAKLSHPNIITIYEAGIVERERSHKPYFAMEYIEGENLLDYINNKDNFTIRELVTIFEKIAYALEFIHKKNIVHRDIKPSNIIMNGEEPNLIDFGIAKLTDSDKTRTRSTSGTLAYMSPEQIMQKEITKSSDIFSLGSVLYKCLTGQFPFQGYGHEIRNKIIDASPTPLRKLDKEIHPDLEAICFKCLNKNPQERYVNANNLAKDLRNFLNNKPISVPHLTQWTEVWSLIKKLIARNKLSVAILALVVIISIAISAILWQKAEFRLARLRKEQKRTKEILTKLTKKERKNQEILRLIDKIINIVGEKNTLRKLDYLGQILREKKERIIKLAVISTFHKMDAELAVPHLITAFKDKDSTIRYYAIRTLCKIQPVKKETIPHLINFLKDKDSRVKYYAIDALGKVGPAAKASVPHLINFLKNKDSTNVIEALGKIGPVAVPHLITALKDKNPMVRSNAAETLGEIGPDAKASVPHLINFLKDKDSTIRYYAIRTLCKIQSVKKETIQPLINLLKDKDSRVKYYAIEALGKAGPAAKASVPHLINFLKNKDSTNVIEALGKIGPVAVPHLITALKDKNPMVRSNAAETLGEIGPDAKAAVPHLITALKDKNSMVRSNATEALGEIGPAAKAAIPHLLKFLKDKDSTNAAKALHYIGPAAKPYLTTALKDKNPIVRSNAAKALDYINPLSLDVMRCSDDYGWLHLEGIHRWRGVQYFITALKDKNPMVRSRAAKVLGRIGPAAKAAIPYLIAFLKDKNSMVRSNATEALGEIGPAAIPYLTTALKDKNPIVRSNAARALGNIRSAAKVVVAHLITALKDKNPIVRSNTAKALGNIRSAAKVVVAHLITTLKDKDSSVRFSAIEALSNIGPAAKRSVPHLITILKGDDFGEESNDEFDLDFDNVRSKAAEALGKIGPVAKRAEPYLMTALKDTDSMVRSKAAEALGKIGPVTKRAVSHLIIALKDKDSMVRSKAAEALGKIGPVTKRAVSHLIIALKDKDSMVRSSAAEALGNIGPVAKRAVPYLMTALMDKYVYVRSDAAEALGNIGPAANIAISYLITILKDEDFGEKSNDEFDFDEFGFDEFEFHNVRFKVAEALGKIDLEGKSLKITKAINEINKALRYRYYNSNLCTIYKKEKKNLIKQSFLKHLSKSQDKYFLDTIATIHAWLKNKNQALYFASKALPKTPKKVHLLLQGKTPKEVEKIMTKR